MAPSILAASSTSVGIDASPAMKMITANGRTRQAWTTMIANSARFGCPSHGGGFAALQPCTPNAPQTTPSRCIFPSVQLMMLNSESKIHSQPIVASETGAAHGQDDEQAHEPLAAEVADEVVGEDRGTDDDDRLRGERDDQRVLERIPEVPVVPGVGEVGQADELPAQRAAARVRQAEVDRPAERNADDDGDEDDRRRDQDRREEAPFLQKLSPPEAARRSHPAGSRCHGR